MKRLYYWCCRNLNPMDWYREVKWFLQRHIRGYSDPDIWNLCGRLPELIHQHLVAYKKLQRYGIPAGIGKDVEKGDHNFAIGSMIWEYKLDAMIEAFRILKDDDFNIEDDCPWYPTRNEPKTEEQKQKEREWFDKDSEKADIQLKKVEHGMKLFSEYIRSLWD